MKKIANSRRQSTMHVVNIISAVQDGKHFPSKVVIQVPSSKETMPLSNTEKEDLKESWCEYKKESIHNFVITITSRYITVQG